MRLTDVHHVLRQRLTSGRAELGISQSELATRANVSRPIISALELGRGNPTLSVLKKLAAALGCDVGNLLTTVQGVAPSKSLDRRQRAGLSTRYSRSGRKPTLRTWLQNPPPESKTAAAKEFGVDLTLLAQNLALTHEQRVRKMAEGALTLQWLRQSKAARNSSK